MAYTEEYLRMQKLAGLITESTYQELLSETYSTNFKMYEDEFLKRGFKRTNEDTSNGGIDDIWYKDFPLGRFGVSIETLDSIGNQENPPKRQRIGYHMFFDPFPKYKKKLFGLLKSKKPIFGVQIDLGEGNIDFGEGLFKINDKDFIPSFFSQVDKTLQTASTITSTSYLSPGDSERTSRPSFPETR